MNKFDLDTAKRWTDKAMEVGESIILKNRKDADMIAYKMKRDGKQVKIQKISKRWGATYGFSVLRTK
tara:strand:+ start:465 stop:665 length:201 start_codon:yes stop_codon:yes gene_type:complete